MKIKNKKKFKDIRQDVIRKKLQQLDKTQNTDFKAMGRLTPPKQKETREGKKYRQHFARIPSSV